jgi:magnesium transporter
VTAQLEQLERQDRLTVEELRDIWVALSAGERLEGFSLLPKAGAEDFFLGLPARDMAELVLGLPPDERRSWMRLAPPDDVADLIQRSPREQREHLLGLLDEPTRKEVAGLLAYREDEAGGLMNPRYARVRPDMTVDEAISYLRKQARAHLETIYYVYVIDDQQRLVSSR